MSLESLFEDEIEDPRRMASQNQQSDDNWEDGDWDDEEEDSSAPSAVDPLTVRQNVTKPKGLLQHQSEMWDVLDAFEDRAWSGRNYGIKTGWQNIDDAFEGGLKTGWVIIGGTSNIGKTSFLSQMAWQIAHANSDVYVLDFSLDDPMHDKIPRVVASANRVIINAVGNPKGYSQYPEMLKRRNQGLEMVRNAVNKYRALDANHSTDIDIIEETIKKTLVGLQEEADQNGTECRRLVVLIDNFHDLTTTAKEATQGDKQKYDYLAQRVSDMATKYDIPLVTTGEFKKLNGFRRPGKDDLRESVKIIYEAKAILLCHNEVGLKGEAAGIYYDRQGKAEKQPVFEVSFGKNKFGSFKGRHFFDFYPELAFFDPADKASTRKYNNLIYSND